MNSENAKKKKLTLHTQLDKRRERGGCEAQSKKTK
jgi:hypothetical protein